MNNQGAITIKVNMKELMEVQGKRAGPATMAGRNFNLQLKISNVAEHTHEILYKYPSLPIG